MAARVSFRGDQGSCLFVAACAPPPRQLLAPPRQLLAPPLPSPARSRPRQCPRRRRAVIKISACKSPAASSRGILGISPKAFYTSSQRTSRIRAVSSRPPVLRGVPVVQWHGYVGVAPDRSAHGVASPAPLPGRPESPHAGIFPLHGSETMRPLYRPQPSLTRAPLPDTDEPSHRFPIPTF